jgi:hypothetical protein
LKKKLAEQRKHLDELDKHMYVITIPFLHYIAPPLLTTILPSATSLARNQAVNTIRRSTTPESQTVTDHRPVDWVLQGETLYRTEKGAISLDDPMRSVADKF